MNQTDHKRTETEETVHGTVEYEVYECVACAQEYRSENMTFLYDGNVESVDRHSSWQTVRFKGHSFTRLPFCPSCYEEPTRIELPHITNRRDALLLGIVLFLVGVLFGMVLFV